jgi:hypothetical protein
MAKFRIGIFLLAFFTISLSTIISWLFAFRKDEGQINEKTEPIKNFIADSFNLFRCPTHQVSEPWILSNGIAWYFPGLILKCCYLDNFDRKTIFKDFGPSYYFDLGQGSEFKTLFLFGQYLMDFKRKTFPSTEFQVIKANSGQVIDVIPTGGYLKPVKTDIESIFERGLQKR